MNCPYTLSQSRKERKGHKDERRALKHPAEDMKAPGGANRFQPVGLAGTEAVAEPGFSGYQDGQDGSIRTTPSGFQPASPQWAMVMTTLARACPPSTYCIASAACSSG